jgi:radical SAM protein with 4Fe4S-binding SPASM domain
MMAARAYQLSEGVLFVAGASRGAVLDTASGTVYSLNEEACSVLRYEAEDDPYWETLVSMGLAEPTPAVRAQALPRTDAGRLNYLWLEVVTDDCNERCVHCYADSMPKTYRRSLPLMQNVPTRSDAPAKPDAPARPHLTHEDWIAVLDEAAGLGARACQFIGGEPFLYRGPKGETLLDLVLAAKQRGFSSIEIVTNATLITPEKARRLKELGAGIVMTIHSDVAEVHDAITRLPGSHAKTMKALELLTEIGVPTRVEFVLMRQNQHTLESTLAQRKERGWGERPPDVIRPKGRGDDAALQPDFEKVVHYGLLLGPNFVASHDTVAHYASGHSCLMGRIGITEFGDVLPCIFTRNHVMGNVLASRGLAPILRAPALRQVWSATKDQVMVCRDCEYRYVCFDCRPLSESAAAGKADYLHAPYPRCTYNPYTGEWRAGLWRVDAEGQPYYDRSQAAQIQAAAASAPVQQHQHAGH